MAAKAVAKAVAAAVKAIVAGVKELVAAIAAGGWVAVIATVIICLIGVIIASPFGIFFSGNNRDDGAVTASAAVAQVMYDFNSKLEDLQDGDYDDITISGSLADWPEVLAVFAVKVAGNNDVDAMDVATLDQKRIKKLKDVFWDMNAISTEVETIDYPDSDPEDDVDDSWSESILHITITSKTAEEMKTRYHFSEKQKKMLDELLESRDALLELIGDLQFISTDAYELLKHLPDDLSEERRKVIKTACSLVGKVNYFWGGKSLVIGWDSRWGSIQKVWADGSPTTGTYRPYGLDCSGFVDWVFYGYDWVLFNDARQVFDPFFSSVFFTSGPTQLVLLVFVVPKFRSSNVAGNSNVLTWLVAGILNCLDQVLEWFFIVGKVRSKTTFVTN